MNATWLILVLVVVLAMGMMKKKPPGDLDMPPSSDPAHEKSTGVDPALAVCREFYQRAVDAECGPDVRFVAYPGGPLVELSGTSCANIYENYLERRQSCAVFGPPVGPPGYPTGFDPENRLGYH